MKRSSRLAVSLVLVLALASLPSDGLSQGAPTGPLDLGAFTADVIAELDFLAAPVTVAGELMAMVQALFQSPDLVQMVLRLLDLNDDGALTFDEVLKADVLGIARAVKQAMFLDDGGPVIGKDETLTAMTSGFLQQIRADLQLGAGNEFELPAVQLTAMNGDPAGFVAGVPKTLLGTLEDLVADLDTRGVPNGDMVHHNMHVNIARKHILMREAGRLIPTLERGNTRALRNHLGWLRSRGDGEDKIPDWFAGPKAERIVARIDRLLHLLPQ